MNHHHHPRYHNHHQQQQTKAISTIAAAVTARRKQQRRRVGIPFFLLLVLITLFVALTVTFLVTVAVLSPLILTTTTSTTLSNYDSSSSSYLLDFLEDFTYAKPRRRPWRNNDSNTSNNSTNSASTDDHSNVSNIVPWVIFYHIYIPPRKGKVGQAKALEVVEEQLAQVAASRNNYYHLKSAKNNNNMTASQQQQQHYHSTTASSSLVVWTVYYTTTGVANVITTSWMRQACRAHFLNCIPTEPHLLVGDEDVTLNHLYDYCQYHKQQEDESSVVDSTRHDDDRAAVVVVYMHTKGTHHAAQGRNDAWRRHLTAAVTYPDCLHAVSTSTTTTTTTTTTRQQEHDDFELLEKKCDVCGLQFYPIWTTFFPGNFWTARCSYIQTLLPLPNYTLALHDAVASAFPASNASSSSTTTTSSTSWQAELYRANNPGNVGLGRFAAEHWIASHPHVQPCDLSESNRITDYWTTAAAAATAAAAESSEVQQQQQMLQQDHNWSLALAPRQSIHAPAWFRLNRTALVDILHEEPAAPGTKRLREWFLLPGFLYRWKRIYGLYPKADSWIWGWYPNGQDWKQCVLFSTTAAGQQQQQPKEESLFPLWWLDSPE